MKKVCHITTVHSRCDVRIFLKECRSLAEAGYEVVLVVADGNGDEIKDGISVVDIGCSNGRFDRMFRVTQRALENAVSIDADIYHFHDPELIPVGRKLKSAGKTVIFDSHEDVPKQLLCKPYLNPLVKRLLSKVFAAYEAWACKHFDAIITATPFIRNKFLEINPNSVDINNFPILGELSVESIDWTKKRNEVCYVGSISAMRGIEEIVHAMWQVNGGTHLQLCGEFSERYVLERCKELAGWKNVNELGWLDRSGVKDVLQYSVAGLVVLHPTLSYIDALPIKMFEYMSAGLPVIASDFPLWREIIDGNECGLCVDPMKPQEIAAAIDFLVNNPEQARDMGENGRRAVQDHYNWSVEAKKLAHLYKSLPS